MIDPALQGLSVQPGLSGRIGHRQPRFPQHLAGSPQEPGSLAGQDVAQLQGLALQEFLEIGFQISYALRLLLILGDDRFGSQGELMGFGALKDPLQGVEIAGGNGIVLVVVAAWRRPPSAPERSGW